MNLHTRVAPDSRVVRLHLSENHLGYSPKIRPLIDGVLDSAHLYPDPEVTELREALAQVHAVSDRHIFVGNGSDEILFILAHALLDPSKRAVVVEQSFPGYATSARLTGAEVERVSLVNYRVDLSAIASRCREADVAFVCNPNNPTGTIVSRDAITEFLRSMERSHAIAVIDEAYAEYAGDDFASAIPNILSGARALVMRTFSKAFGLAGFRVGYAIGPVEIIDAMLTVRRSMPFGVNHIAQAAALAALSDQAFVQHVHDTNERVRRRFCSALERAGIGYVPSCTNFLLVRAAGHSAELAAVLSRDFGVLTRDTTPFGLPGHIRISMPPEDHLDAVVETVISAFAYSLSIPHGPQQERPMQWQ